MVKKLSLGIVLFFVLSLVAGCANIKDDSQRTQAEGATAGAAGGAVFGAILGQVIGGDTGATLLGAAIGGAVGGIGGYAYGDHIAGQKEQYSNQEDWLDACIAEAQKKNRELEDYNQNIVQQIAQLREETEALQARTTEAETRKAKLFEKKERVDQLLAAADTELASAKAELEAQNSVITEVKQEGQSDFTQSLDSEIELLKANIKDLENQTEVLASMSASMSV